MRPPEALPGEAEVRVAQRSAALGVGVAAAVGATVAGLTVLLADTADIGPLALPAAMLTLVGFLYAGQRPGRVAALARRELTVAGGRRGRLELGWSALLGRPRPHGPDEQQVRAQWAAVAQARLSLAVPMTTLVSLAMGLAALQSVLQSGVWLAPALALLGSGGLLGLLIGQVALLQVLRRDAKELPPHDDRGPES